MPSSPIRRRSLRRSSPLVGALLVGVLALVSACGEDESSSSGAPSAGQEAAAAALDQDAVVIDVRTPEEFDAGHIEGAQLLDIQSADFAAGMAELDADQTYVVYCRSGNRSAAATEQMQAAGLTVLDGGGMGDMVAAGWPEA
jgi:phage shock protein E